MFLIDGASRVTAPKEARPQALFRFALPWVGFVGYVRELFIKSVERVSLRSPPQPKRPVRRHCLDFRSHCANCNKYDPIKKYRRLLPDSSDVEYRSSAEVARQELVSQANSRILISNS